MGLIRTAIIKRKYIISKYSQTTGWTKHPLYNTWKRMKGRCYNKNDNRYESYGGRRLYDFLKTWVNGLPDYYSIE